MFAAAATHEPGAPAAPPLLGQDAAADPSGAERTLWAARTSGGGAWKLGTVTTPALSPDGTTVAYAKDGQIYAYEVRLKPDTTGATAFRECPVSTYR